jgi:hypothetical protein
MRVFQIEPFAFQAAKQRLYLPTFAVCFNPLTLFVTANHQQLPVGQTGRFKIVLLPIHHHRPNFFPSPVFSARKWPFKAGLVPPFSVICAFSLQRMQ